MNSQRTFLNGMYFKLTQIRGPHRFWNTLLLVTLNSFLNLVGYVWTQVAYPKPRLYCLQAVCFRLVIPCSESQLCPLEKGGNPITHTTGLL